MKVKFVLRDGQTITTNSFKNGLEDYLYRALKESGKTSVFIIKAENDTSCLGCPTSCGLTSRVEMLRASRGARQ